MDGSRSEAHLASENEVLRRDLADARAEISAANEVLATMGRSASDLDLVLGTRSSTAPASCVERMARASNCVNGTCPSGPLVGALGRLRRAHDGTTRSTLDRNSLIGRVASGPAAAQIRDVLADPDYGAAGRAADRGLSHDHGCADAARRRRHRGAPVVWRTDVDPFEDRAVTSAHAFAAAAAIAVRNLDLVRALEGRSAELAHKVDQLEALGELGEAVSSSLDLDTVLSTIVAHAVAAVGHRRRLVDGVRRGPAALLRAHGVRHERRGRWSSCADVEISLHDTFVGRAALEGRPLQVADMTGPDLDVHQRLLYDAGWRSMVAVPMLREGDIVGVLVVRRTTRRATSRRRRASCCRRSPASRRWRSSTLGCSASWSARPPSCRWSAGTSRSSSPACRTSCAPR